MNPRFLAWMAAAGLISGLPLARGAPPASYPTKPIRLIVPSAPGSPPDLVGRVIGEKLAAALGQSVVVDNRSGATGIIGLEAVARSAADGYTLGVIGMPFIVIASLVGKMPYDTAQDLAAVAQVSWHYHVLAVPAGSTVKSVSDLIAAAKSKPGVIKYSSGGNGTPAHVAAEFFKREASVSILHVPYKAAPAAVVAVLSGEVDVMIGSVGQLSAHIKAGKLRALATPAPQRIAAYPELPTFTELGYPGVQIRDWLGVVAPAGTPNHLIARLHAEIAKATVMPDVTQRLEGFGMEGASAGPEQFAAHIRSEIQRWSKLIRDTGIKAD